MLYWSAGMGTATPAWLHGGDYDGDLNMFSFDKDFIDVVKATEGRIRQLPVEDLDQQVKDRMMELELEKAKAMDEEVEFELRGYSKKELEALLTSFRHTCSFAYMAADATTAGLGLRPCRACSSLCVEATPRCSVELILQSRPHCTQGHGCPQALQSRKPCKGHGRGGQGSQDRAEDPPQHESRVQRPQWPAAADAGPAAPQYFQRPWRHGWMTDALVIMVQSGFHARQWCWGRRRRRRCWKRCSTSQKISSSSSGRPSGSPFGRSPGLLRTSWSGAFGAGQILGCLLHPDCGMHPRQPHDLDDEDGRTQQKHVAAVKVSAIPKKHPVPLPA